MLHSRWGQTPTSCGTQFVHSTNTLRQCVDMANGFVLIDCSMSIVPTSQRMPVTFCIENSAGLKQICLVGAKAPAPAPGELDACKQG